MMTRLILIGLGLVAVAAIVAVGTGYTTDDFISWADREEMRHSQSVTLETDTRVDETVPTVAATEEPEVRLTTEAEGVEDVSMGDNSILTVDGYDAQQVRYLLISADMPVEVREDYLSRLEAAAGDADELGAVLSALRAELASG